MDACTLLPEWSCWCYWRSRSATKRYSDTKPMTHDVNNGDVRRSDMKASSRRLLSEIDHANREREPWQRIEGWPRRPENRA
jgi:hypothetical protein